MKTLGAVPRNEHLSAAQATACDDALGAHELDCFLCGAWPAASTLFQVPCTNCSQISHPRWQSCLRTSHTSAFYGTVVSLPRQTQKLLGRTDLASQGIRAVLQCEISALPCRSAANDRSVVGSSTVLAVHCFVVDV